MHPDRIVLSPGPCTPQEAGISIELVRHFAGKVPILGVCLGHQAMGAAFGGEIVRAANLMHGKTSQVLHDNKTIFQDLPMPMTATRYHSLIVEEKSLPAELEISAYTTESDGSARDHGTAAPAVSRRGRAVSSRERADGRRKKADQQFPRAIVHCPSTLSGNPAECVSTQNFSSRIELQVTLRIRQSGVRMNRRA